MIKDIWCSGNENYRYLSGWISWLELFLCTIIKYCSKGIILSVYRIYKNILHFEFYYHLYTPWHLLYTCFYHLVLASIFVTCYILQIEFYYLVLAQFQLSWVRKTAAGVDLWQFPDRALHHSRNQWPVSFSGDCRTGLQEGSTSVSSH